MRAALLIPLAVLGCGSPEHPERVDDSTSTTAGVVVGTPAGTAGGTGGPTDTGTVVDPCPGNPVPLSWFGIDVQTEEDFDFDAEGYLLYQSGTALVGTDYVGGFKVVSPNVSVDPSGVNVLADGGIVVGAQDEGLLRLVNPLTGGTTNLVSGLTQPNGIEIGNDGRVYFTEFTVTGRVRWYDPTTGDQGLILGDTYMPNGLVLSPDEQTLYIGGNSSVGTAAILAVDRTGPDTWSAPRELHTSTAHDFDAVEVDVCGHVYTVEYSSGRVLKIAPDGSSVEPIAQLEDANAWWAEYNAMRWGNGRGGWERDVLYVTNRSHVFAVDVGILGKPSPNAAP